MATISTWKRGEIRKLNCGSKPIFFTNSIELNESPREKILSHPKVPSKRAQLP